jgi:PBSX family phage portal protein
VKDNMVKLVKVHKGGGRSLVPVAAPKSQVSFYGGTRKADTAKYVVNATDNQPDDTFYGSYTASGANGAVSAIQPTFEPLQLLALVTKNNILSQCIDAMEVNIDGTGHDFVKIDEEMPDDDAELQMLKDFFDEPYPGKTMIGIRRGMRRDEESTGCGYFEVARNAAGDIMTVNHLDAENMRLIRYDDPVPAKKLVQRNGKQVEVTVTVRERRFLQIINTRRVYFREFGSSRDLDKETGLWAKPGETLPADKRASEILYFTVNKEVRTPYGSPRWINQLPSVLGSRKAEEYNLEFFDAGGLPPVLVLVQGGYLGSDVKQDLQAHLSGSGAKHRAAVVEAIAASGSLDSAGTVKVTVERFGTERQNDSMFQEYDKNCEDHVRVAFRLPPLFTGRSEDINFASALTSYLVAEAQVFLPERMEFDDRINLVVKALGAKTYRFKSNQANLSDMEKQITAIQTALTNKMVDPESAMEHLNKAAGTKMEFQPPPEPEPKADPVDQAYAMQRAKMGLNPHKPPSDAEKAYFKPKTALRKPVGTKVSGGSMQQNADRTKIKAPVAKAGDEWTHLAYLAEAYAGVLGLRGPCPYDDERVEVIKSEVDDLEGIERKVFNTFLAQQSLVQINGAEGIAELCGCAADLLAERV